VIGNLRRKIRASPAPSGLAPGPATPMEFTRESIEIELSAYAEDCLVFGFVLVDTDRLTDYLNQSDRYEMRDVLVVSIEDGSSSEARTLAVERSELLAVRASGPRGSIGRRERTRPYPVTLKTGPYTICGHLHGPAGGDPIVQLRFRPPMVALTESWIEYCCDDETHRGRVGTILVNREAIDWIHHSADEEVLLPHLPAETRPDPKAKDLTGHIWIRRP
jgi:hypothetical protein